MDSQCENVVRPLAEFPEGICNDYYLESEHDSLNAQQMEAYAKEIDSLKEQVRAMLVDTSLDHKAKLDLINAVHRLGLSSYFETEIARQLELIFQAYNYENNYNLCIVSLHFRIFRQYGHKMSCDVFNKFKDSNGGLQEDLKRDVKGILSLYEATHLMMHGDEFLEEALDLTTVVLSSFASESNLEDQCLYKQVVRATKQPMHKGITRVETRYFIDFYEEEESRNDTLLRLAKLDFNILQLLHRQELKQIVKWWNGLNVKTQLPYMRDRSLECHFWATAISFRASHSRARMFTAKILNIITILDDTYDAYGTFEELGLLTQAFERWDKDSIDELPVKMKRVFSYVFNLFDEFEKEMVNEEREYAANYAKARIVDLIRSYYKEANWAHQRYIPSYEEYMEEAAMLSSTTQSIITCFMLEMEERIANEREIFDWITKPVPRVIRALEVIGRLMNDITSHEDEQKRAVHVASAVECYMNEHGASEEETVTALEQMLNDAWKDLNEELVSPTKISSIMLQVLVNTGRAYYYHYKEIDGYTHSRKAIKDDALLVYTKAFNV